MQEKRITCLLIDDDIDDRELFAHALKHLNIKADFVTASDGQHAIDKINADSGFNPYFIFIDVNMPKMSGIECLVEIKKISKIKASPVYLYSTYGDPKILKEGKKHGAVDLLVKAHSMKELEQMLSKILPTEKDF